jgi:hypothetical protein
MNGSYRDGGHLRHRDDADLTRSARRVTLSGPDLFDRRWPEA